MSRTVKGWMARAGSATARMQAKRKRFRASAGEESVYVVVEREEGEPEEKCQAQPLSDFHGLLRNRTALHDLGEIIHQVPPIEERNGQQVEHAQAHAHEGEEAQVGDPSQLRGLARVVRDR